MATDLEPRTAAAKYDAFVGKQVGDVQARIRRLDVVRSFLWLGVAILGYGLTMAVFDLAAGPRSTLSGPVHLLSFVVFLGGAGFFLGQGVFRFYRRINPYYAAKQLEETIPEAKNSVINWLDLRDEELPGAIRGAVGQKAAKDLKRTDSEKVVNPRSNWLLFSILAALVLGVLILLATRPNQFSSLMNRAYAPFLDPTLRTQTEITILEPKGGDATVAPDKSVTIRARITGRYPGVNEPGAPRLLFRYNPADNFVAVPLEEEGDGGWAILRKPDQVRTGFYYKVAAGDTETGEHQIIARGDPRPERFEVTYKFRPYLRLAERSELFPNDKMIEPRIQGRRGTEVSVTVFTNRKLKAGEIVLEAGGEKLTFPGRVSDDGRSFRAHWVLEKSGTFRVVFTSTDDEPNSSAALYTVLVDEDAVPQVVLTEPGKDTSLPADGTLNLAGYATDDLGIRSLTLRLKVIEGAKADLAGKPFRGGKDFKFEDGAYPDKVEYRDFLALSSLKTPDGKAFAAKPGMVLEYWLEARDNSDYPRPEGNLGVSKSFKLKIDPPSGDEKKRKEEQDRAAEKQKQFEKEQDQKLKNEHDKTGGGGGAKDETDDLKNKAKELAKKIEKDRRDKNPGEGKGEEGAAPKSKEGEKGKEGAEPKSKEGKSGEKKDTAASKGEGTKAGSPPPAEARDKGEAGKDKTAGASRDSGTGPPPTTAKGSDEKTEKSDAKGGPGKMGPDSSAGEPRGAGDKGMETKAGDARGDDKKTETAGAPKTGETGGMDAARPGVKDATKKDGDSPPATASKGGPGGDMKEKVTKGRPEDGPAKTGVEKRVDDTGTAKVEDFTPRGEGKKADAKGDAPPTHAKGGKIGPDELKGAEVKKGPPKGRGAEPRDDGRAEAGPEKDRKLTPEDIAKLEKDLRDAGRSEDAARELRDIAGGSKDAELRDAAEKALKKDGRTVGSPGRAKDGKEKKIEPDETGSAKKGPDLKKKKSDPGRTVTGDPEKGDALAKGAGDEEGKTPPKKDEMVKGEGKTGEFGPGARGMSDKDLKAIKAVEDFLKHGGDLQLDDFATYLKKFATDKTLSDAGWKKEDLDRWLKAAAEHDARLSREAAVAERRKKDREKTASGSVLPGTRIDTGTSASATRDPLDARRPLPPPEFRDAHRVFSGTEKK